jgi:hypothetical protein
MPGNSLHLGIMLTKLFCHIFTHPKFFVGNVLKLFTKELKTLIEAYYTFKNLAYDCIFVGMNRCRFCE